MNIPPAEAIFESEAEREEREAVVLADAIRETWPSVDFSIGPEWFVNYPHDGRVES